MIKEKKVGYLLKPIFILFCVVTTLTFINGNVLASNGVSGSVNPYYGSFSTDIPIAVPEYHGIEPKLKLIYNSSGSGMNTWVGVGWSLMGLSYIERASIDGGSPKYDGDDIFYMDGQELIISGLQGGTHCTRIQNYTRIQRDTDNNKWYVWGTNGNKATYTPVFETSGGTFRWMLKTIEDPHGNIVTYNYDCVGSPIEFCYLDTITYNGTVITFYRETRPDPITFATGVHLGRIDDRLKTIDVQVSSSRVRVYKLEYHESETSSRSILTSIQQYGNDTVLDGHGAITGGSDLPAMTMDWPRGSNEFNDPESWHWYAPTNGVNKSWLGDFNGDGKTDSMYLSPSPHKYMVMLSNGTGFDAPVNWKDYTSVNDFEDQFWVNDFNGDGKSDIMYLSTAPHKFMVMLSNGTGFDDPVNWKDYPSFYTINFEDCFWVNDFNGDGKNDAMYIGYIQIPEDLIPTGYMVMLSNSNGDGFEDPVNWHDYLQVNSVDQIWIADYNGDGKSDVMYLSSSPHKYMVMLNNGDGFEDPQNWKDYIPINAWVSFWVVDMNNDNRSDIMYLSTAPHKYMVMLNNGTGFDDPVNWKDYTPINGWNQFWINDFNGDAKNDIMYLSTDPHHYMVMENNSSVDLINRITNGIGGETTIEYTPSSEWDNTLLPMVIPTVTNYTTSDGRGNVSSTDYQYEGGDFSFDERRFLGFLKVTAVLDPQGNYTETYYLQQEGSISKPEYTYFKDNQGNIFSYSEYEYTPNSSPPYTSLLTKRLDFTCNQSANCYFTSIGFSYDQYGNVVASYEYGDDDITGDERTTVRGYSENTTDYIVGLPAYERTYEGEGIGGTLLKETLYYYDDNPSYENPPTEGNITQVKEWNSETQGYVSVSMEYDSWGNLRRKVDERDSETTTVYDSTYHIFPVQECNDLGHCVTNEWDTISGDTVMGLLTSSTDVENDATTSHTHDVFGRVVAKTQPDGGVITYEYLDWGDPHNQRIKKTLPDGTPDGLWTEVYQDGVGREYEIVKEGGFTKVTEYTDASSRVWRKSLWFGSGETPRHITYAYDGAGRLRTTTNPDGTMAERVYANDGYGKPYEVIYDELGNEKVIWKDAYGNITQIREYNEGEYYYTTYEYDMLGNPVRIIDAMGNISTSTWSSLGNKLSTTDPDMGTWTYTYDEGSLLLTQKDNNNKTTSFAYDDLGRILTKTLPGSTLVNYYYDEAGYGASVGRLTRVVYPSGSETHAWNKMGFETSATRCVSGTCKTISQTYDLLGRVSSIEYPGPEVVNHQYDDTGQLSSVGGYASSLSWNSSGQLTTMTYTNGTINNFIYNPERKWLETATVNGSLGHLYNVSYAYDAGARVISTTSNTHTELNMSYTYDALNRLKSAVYDDILQSSGVTTRQYAYNDTNHLHAVTQAGTNNYDYDNNGNMIQGAGRTMTWDDENRLISVAYSGGTSMFLYDADGNRMQKIDSQGTTKYFGSLVEEKNGSLVKYYYAGPMLIAKKDSTGTYWYHSDHLGSVRLITDSNGIENEYGYSPFGETISESGSVDNERGFTGHIRDAPSGLVYMKARYYDPELGVFISADTIVPDPFNPQALNRYAYVYNNPISNIDPTGHLPVVAAVISVIATKGAPLLVKYVAWIGAGLSVAGYCLEDPVLSSIGGVMLGFSGGYWMNGVGSASGGILGASVAGASSPISPLDPGIKQAIGWAYTAYGLMKWYDARKTQKLLENKTNLKNSVTIEKAESVLIDELMPITPEDGFGQWAGETLHEWKGKLGPKVRITLENLDVIPTGCHIKAYVKIGSRLVEVGKQGMTIPGFNIIRKFFNLTQNNVKHAFFSTKWGVHNWVIRVWTPTIPTNFLVNYTIRSNWVPSMPPLGPMPVFWERDL